MSEIFSGFYPQLPFFKVLNPPRVFFLVCLLFCWGEGNTSLFNSLPYCTPLHKVEGDYPSHGPLSICYICSFHQNLTLNTPLEKIKVQLEAF